MRHVNVLVVDDDTESRQELRTLLTELGHTVIGETDSTAKGLTLARSLRPDLIFVEFALTTGSTPEFIETLSTERIAPALLITANSDAATLALDRLCRAGAMGFFAKPLRRADLTLAIPVLLARWTQLSEMEGEIKSLNERMEARKLVGRAKAILMERFQLPERDAFKRIQAQSVSMNKPVHEIARAIITAHDVSG